MDLLTLNPSTYLPADMVQGWKSLVWTERFRKSGDFELKTENIEETLKMLPLGTFVTVRDSTEVMRVEGISIDESEAGADETDAPPIATFKGRTVESFLEKRRLAGDIQFDIGVNTGAVDSDGNLSVSEKPSDTRWQMLRKYYPYQAAALLIWNTVVDVEPVITGVSGSVDSIDKRHYTGDPRDIIPNLCVTITGPFNAPADDIWLELGNLYERVTELLEAGDIGLRAIRPPSVNTRVVSFNASGAMAITTVATQGKLRFDVYQGVNRTVGQTAYTPVIFSHATGDLLSSTYVYSSYDQINVAATDSDAWGVIEVQDTPGYEAVGWSRLIDYAAATTPQNKRGLAKYKKALQQEGYRRLRKQPPRIIFDAKVSPNAVPQYRKHYNLGDYVTVYGNYKIRKTMRCTEFIRVEDETGYAGYPTLIIPGSDQST